MLSPLKSIRKYCLGCCNDSPKEVKLCPANDCPLWVYRFGKRVRDPNSIIKQKFTRTLSPEHLEKMKEGRKKAKTGDYLTTYNKQYTIMEELE